MALRVPPADYTAIKERLLLGRWSIAIRENSGSLTAGRFAPGIATVDGHSERRKKLELRP